MEQTVNEDEECGICLDALTNPVSLPCSHKFCSECLNGWRSKYGWVAPKPGEQKMEDRKCPLCREEIPPSKEMLAQLKSLRMAMSRMEARGDIFSQDYIMFKSKLEQLESDVGDWTEAIDYSGDDKKGLALPTDIFQSAKGNNIQKVLDWLGIPPVDKQRVNARCPDYFDFTLVHCAVMNNNSDLLSILLQLGADVDPLDATGGIPLTTCFEPEDYALARLLLEWGAEICNDTMYSKDKFIKKALENGNNKLVNLLKSEFGGRRCEIINMPNQPDLVGKTCVVDKHLPNKGRYKVTFEESNEVGLVGPHNLKRRDRTPDNCGYYITYKNGRISRHEFALKEECQAFIASLDEAEAAAESRAEQAAADLLAELNIDVSADSDKRGKKGKTKGKKKGGK